MIQEIREALPGLAAVDGTEVFVLRDGVRFGMKPKAVIEAELACGYQNKVYGSDFSDGVLFNSGNDYQLYYPAKARKLGPLPLFRFEYDFDLKDKRLYQFYYVFEEKNESLFFPLSLALQARHRPVCAGSGRKTQRFSLALEKNIRAHSQWILPDGEKKEILADLWLSDADTCYLIYQSAERQ